MSAKDLLDEMDRVESAARSLSKYGATPDQFHFSPGLRMYLWEPTEAQWETWAQDVLEQQKLLEGFSEPPSNDEEAAAQANLIEEALVGDPIYRSGMINLYCQSYRDRRGIPTWPEELKQPDSNPDKGPEPGTSSAAPTQLGLTRG